MEELLKIIPREAGWKVAGWLFTAVVTLSTMLYKGIWKRINQIAEDVEDVRTDTDRLIGACGANHPNQKHWDGVERRKNKRGDDNDED